LRGHQNRLGGWSASKRRPCDARRNRHHRDRYLVSAELLKPLAVAQTGRAEYKVNRADVAPDAMHVTFWDARA